MDNNKTYNLTLEQLNDEKNKTLAKFASVVSHDLKNVVGGLSNIAYYITKAMKIENSTQEKMIALLSKEVTNLNSRIVELLDMTRVKLIQKEHFKLSTIIEEVIKEQKNDKIKFEINLTDTDIFADKKRIAQVFSNIIKNSKEAIKDFGIISIQTCIKNDKVYIVLSDNGCGMTSEILEHCLDPMFSVNKNKAMGMGLTVAKIVVQMHNGTFNISSKENIGTQVQITLPLNS